MPQTLAQGYVRMRTTATYEGDSCPTSKGTPHGCHMAPMRESMRAYTRADRHSKNPALPFLLDEDLDPWRCHSKVFNPSLGGLIQRWDIRPYGRANCPISESLSKFHVQCLILVSMLDVQSQVSNFMFSLSFHTLMVAPSSDGWEVYV